MSESSGAMSASVLAGVLVVSTLICISVLMLMSLWDCELLLSSVFLGREQQKADLASAMVCYCHDSTFRNKFQKDSSLFLFPETGTSEVKLRWKQWGLYEVVTAETKNCKTTRLMGKARESFCGANLYIPENRKALGISGNSRIEGKLYVPAKGITYTQVGGEFFRGIPVTVSQVVESEEDFPDFDRKAVCWIEDILQLAKYGGVSGRKSGRQSFDSLLDCRQITRDISGEYLSGHILLWAEDEVCIRKDNYLRNIIVLARKVSVCQGFSGSLQIFARDSVIMEDSVSLKAGSGLWVDGSLPGRLIRLGDQCRVEGYVVVMGNPASPSSLLHYVQPEHSRVDGLVFVDGTAQVQGEVNGSLFVRDLRYSTPGGYYSDLLYRLTLSRRSGIVYPLLLAGPYERREVL